MGNLRAFLITPSFTEPINSLAEVIDSGLEWGLVLYGEEEEIQMAQSTDPVISKIWKDKTVVPLEGHATAVSNRWNIIFDCSLEIKCAINFVKVNDTIFCIYS